MPLILPPLNHWEGSWAIIRKATGECALELHRLDAKLADRMNGDAYEALPIATYLASIGKD